MDNIEKDEITPSDEYVKGFNEGYLIAKFNLDFTSKSISNMSQSDRNQGFNKGVMQYEVEKELDRSISKMFNRDRGTRDISKDKDTDKDIDMGR